MSAPELEALVALARAGDLAPFIARARELEPADLADVLAALDEDERLHVVRSLPPELSAEALVEMPDEAHAEDTLAALEPERAAEIVEELAVDDAADLLGEMEPEDQERILSEVEDPSEVERLLTYDEETAGGRMNPRVVAVHDTASAGQAIEEIRRQSEEIEDFYEVYVVDDRRVLRGLLPMKSLVVSPTDRPVRTIMEEPTVSVLPETDQEEVARLMSRYNLPAVPVVDAGGHLLGSITFDDVVDVVEAETTEDILRFGGVSADEELGAGWRDSVRSRLPWLMLNLLTAFVAGAVVYANHTTIERIVLLAAWMPIIAGMGGNTGTQALAVTVRRLALGLIPIGQFRRVVGKEMLVGLTNGVALGAIAALVATALGQGPMLGLVVMLAMAGNLFVAGFAGAFIPILLQRLGVDPAVASSIFVTTFTDVCGFTLLLGLAGTLLL